MDKEGRRELGGLERGFYIRLPSIQAVLTLLIDWQARLGALQTYQATLEPKSLPALSGKSESGEPCGSLLELPQALR